MPLAYPSTSHGQVAFGFFHLETPLLLLDRRLFWCAEFCALVDRLLATAPGRPWRDTLPGWRAHDLGDLHAALAGRPGGGLIGALYRRSPFPRDPAAFRQRAAGTLDTAWVEAELACHATATPFACGAAAGRCWLDDVEFDAAGLRRLLDYVWRGGMPGWDAALRPAYLERAAARWRAAGGPWCSGMRFDPAAVGLRPGYLGRDPDAAG